jgi:hypothetical protein
MLCLTIAAHAQTPISVDEAATRLSFPSGHFLLDLPVRAEAAATIAVTASVLNVDDTILSTATAPCTLTPGVIHCQLSLPAVAEQDRNRTGPIPLLRVRYSVASTTGILALDHIAPDLYELHVAAPQNIHPGGTYTAHIRALHPLSGEPRANVAISAVVSASYEDDEKDQTLRRVSLRTNAQGFATLDFTAPAKPALDSIDIKLDGALANLHMATCQSIDVPEHASLALTTDKPLYQPGQTVHLRALLLDRTGHATAREKVTFDVKDPDSTLVFRTGAPTSSFGIATADWRVPANLRLGQYSIQATPEDSSNTTGVTIRLSRYDLPTFAVTPKPDRPFYLPGTDAVVDVHADYLFGKPVPRGHVRVVREDSRTWNFAEQRFDTQEGEAVEGELDATGIFQAHIDLYDDEQQFVNDDPSNRYQDIHLAAYVTDASTGRTEQRRFDLRVTGQALHLYLAGINNGTQLQPKGLPQQYYLTVTHADGTPVECDADIMLLPVNRGGVDETLSDRLKRAISLKHLRTDSLGLARLDLPEYEALRKMAPPAPDRGALGQNESPAIYIAVHNPGGESGGSVEELSEPSGVLRVGTSKAIYRSGDPIDVTLDSAQPALPVTVELLRRTTHGDIVLATRDLTLKAGHAQLSFPTDAEDSNFSGMLFVSAISLRDQAGPYQRYRWGRDADDEDPIVYASRAILFPRDNMLHVDVRMSKTTYRPGDEATATLSVRGPRDFDGDITDPAPSALGLVAVDEAVEERNRTDNEFGNANGQSFFFNRYIPGDGLVGGLSLAQLSQLDLKKPPSAEQQLAAEILLRQFQIEPLTADTAAPTNLSNVFNAAIARELGPARKALAAHIKTDLEAHTDGPAIAALLAGDNIGFDNLRDPWGDPYRLVAAAFNNGQRTLELRSAGPDKQPGTRDDFNVPLANWSWLARFERDLNRMVNAYHDRTGGFIRDLAALTDEAAHDDIDIQSWRDPWNQPFTFAFDVSQADYVVSALTTGDPANPTPLNVYYPIGARARIGYFNGERARIETILNQYAATHPFPTNDAELAAALNIADIHDPWGHGLYATFYARSFYTDRVKVEAHATPTTAPQTRTTITPVTEIADTVTLHSTGPDGKPGTADDFVLTTFTRARSQQSAQQAAAQTPANQTVRSGQTGALMGTVTDPTGAVIGGATVVATNLDSRNEYQVRTEADGTYLIDPIPAGEYDVHISLPGFMDLIYNQVHVLAPNATVLDAKLNVGSAMETVTVSAEAVSLDTSSASVASIVETRSIMNLAMLQPGVLKAEATATPRLRDYFPETLLWRPEVITTPEGNAIARFRVADSITTWRLSAAASTREGNTGAGMAQFRSFQPFFAAFDPPRILTIGDKIALPVTLRNYLAHSVSVRAELKPAAWFRLDSAPTANTQVPSQDSASPVFRFTATGPTVDAPQQFVARATEAADAIARPVTVHPDGIPTFVSATPGVLHPGDNTLTLAIPADALPGDTYATLKLYPNFGTHIRDALVEIAQYPGGCAEQITSTAWPSLLLQRSHPDPALDKKTREYLEEAYENLLDKQTSDGGFAYWNNDRYADAALTAYVVSFLTQAREFIAVDEDMLKRAVAYLAKRQQKDGSWLRLNRDNRPLPVSADDREDRIGTAMLTASIAAMIAGAPDAQPLVGKALAATQSFVEEFDEPYTLASYALAAVAVKDTARSEPAIRRLRAMALSENGGAYWKLETNTPFFGWGRAGRVEATAQTLRALLASGASPQDDLVGRGLLFLDHEQDRHSLWYSTQATARVLDVLSAIALSNTATSKAAPGNLTVTVDGRAAATHALPKPNEDTGPVFLPLAAGLTPGDHRIVLNLPAGAGTATAQIVASLYRPWPGVASTFATTNDEQLRLTVAFSSTSPAVAAPVEATAHIERLGFRGYGMLIAEIGLPPGAGVDRASLETAIAASGYQINHYEVLPDRVLVYLWPNAGGLDIRFRFKLRYAVDGLTAPSTVYDYYNPDSHFDLAPTRFTMP